MLARTTLLACGIALLTNPVIASEPDDRPNATSAASGYRINSFSIDGGTPAESTGAGFRLRGSIGQADAGSLLGAGYRLQGGFRYSVGIPPTAEVFANGFESTTP